MHLPPFQQNAWVAVLKLFQLLGDVLIDLDPISRTMSPPSGAAPPLRRFGGRTRGSPPSPNSDSQSSCGFRSCAKSPSPPTLLSVSPAWWSCQPERWLAACVAVEDGRDRERRYKETKEVRIEENAHWEKAAHRFCAFPPHLTIQDCGFSAEASQLLVMTKDWATMLLHGARTQASRCAHKAVQALFIYFCWTTNMFTIGQIWDEIEEILVILSSISSILFDRINIRCLWFFFKRRKLTRKVW